MVYLDKDDLSDIVRAAFNASGQKLDMDGEFYVKNIRSAEYSTILNIAFSTLRFEDKVLLNAPFGKEVRNIDFMQKLKEKANNMGAELIMIWVTAPVEVCHERMKKRNSDRDILKLKNWAEYVEKINYAPPVELKERDAVDKFFVFNTENDKTVNECLAKALDIISK